MTLAVFLEIKAERQIIPAADVHRAEMFFRKYFIKVSR
jgi:hypothetical protein